MYPWSKGKTKETDMRLKHISEVNRNPSEELRRKISEANKGRTPWNKGKKMSSLSEEHKEKISNALKGKLPKNFELLHSPEIRKKAHLANRGGKRSQETKERISQALMGNKNSIGATPWNKGLTKKTDERVKRISESNVGHIPWNKGKTGVYSKKMLKRILARRIPSSLEKRFQQIMDKFNLPYRYVGDGSFIIGSYNPDFININNEKIAIEVYVRYHKLRSNKSIKQWKEQRNKVFGKYGWKIIYFDETEINEDKILLALRRKSH